jgi:hypothetical protein
LSPLIFNVHIAKRISYFKELSIAVWHFDRRMMGMSAMLNGIRAVLIILSLGMIVNSSAKDLVIEGKVVAVAPFSLEINGSIYVNVLVQISKSDKSDENIVCIRLSVREYEYNKWRSDIESAKRFRIKPSETKEMEVIEHIPFVDMDGTSIYSGEDLWQILPEGRTVKIPFGQKVPLYESLDWPVRPVI